MITQAETSLLRVAFARNATAQQPPRKGATSNATGTQQPPAKPASLLDIARNKLRNKLATGTENDAQQAPQKTSGVVAQETTSRCWLIHYADHDPVEVYILPEPTHTEVLRDYPGAIAAQPVPDIPKRKPIEAEAKELTALVNQIYANDTEANREEALVAALADPDDALLCYRAIRDTPGTRAAALSLPGNAIAPPDRNKCAQAHPGWRAA